MYTQMTNKEGSATQKKNERRRVACDESTKKKKKKKLIKKKKKKKKRDLERIYIILPLLSSLIDKFTKGSKISKRFIPEVDCLLSMFFRLPACAMTYALSL